MKERKRYIESERERKGRGKRVRVRKRERKRERNSFFYLSCLFMAAVKGFLCSPIQRNLLFPKDLYLIEL